jgi:hypothetical protein
MSAIANNLSPGAVRPTVVSLAKAVIGLDFCADRYRP